jgi:DNA-binding response OmpR family regulator
MQTESPLRPRLLIVDDEPDVLFTLSHCFDLRQYYVETAVSGKESLSKIEKNAYSLIFLDLNMTPISGLEVLTELRKINQETVVIILTAFSTLDSAIEAIRLGAFDYLIKPISVETIRQRAADALERYEKNRLLTQAQSTPQHTTTLVSGDLTLNLHQQTASYAGHPLELTTTQFKILLTLVQSAPQPLAPIKLVEKTLGYKCTPIEAAGLMKFHIHELRQKLEPAPEKPCHIRTVRLEGYLWCK